MSSRPIVGPTQPHTQWVPGTSSPGVKRPGREADHSSPTNAEDKNAWIYISTSPYTFMHRNNVVFLLLFRSSFETEISYRGDEFACVDSSQEPYLGVQSFVHFTRFLELQPVVPSTLYLPGYSLQPVRSVLFIRAVRYKTRAI
jgi:hypothetical protein